jgi:MinD-like ATPase involved in chromosome partitioning or flagellar assembly
LTNQDHDTPVPADVQVSADRAGVVGEQAGEPGSGGPGAAEPGAAQPEPAAPPASGGYVGSPAMGRPASPYPLPRQVADHPDYQAMPPLPRYGDDPYHGGQAQGPQPVGEPQNAAKGAHDGPAGYDTRSGYDPHGYGSGGVPVPQAPAYQPADYAYGQTYTDPGQEANWDYGEQGPYPAAPQYGVPAYPESVRQPESSLEPNPGPYPGAPSGPGAGAPRVPGAYPGAPDDATAYPGAPPDVVAYPGAPADAIAYAGAAADQGHEPVYGAPAEYSDKADYGGAAGYGHPAAGQARTPDSGGPLAPLPPRRTDQPTRETADSLTSESLLPTKKPPPGPGWRRAVYRATGGLIRPGESQAELRRRELVLRARTPVAGGHHRVAVMSLKGGVGKTTTTVGLGAMLASLRGDRVIAVDANPDRGTLSDKVRLETAATVRDLLNERAQIQRYADVRAFTSQAPSRLELLASDRDPTVSVAFSEDDYYDVAQVLGHYYSICITDCGTGLLHSAMSGVLRLADQIVLVSSPSVDGARSASATLDWLDAHDFDDLVRNAVVVLSIIRPRSKSTVDLDRLEQHFAARCRAVVQIPYDAHLEEGAEVDLEQLNPETADAYLLLAATAGDGFAWPRRVRAAAS